ncbi:riboflavin biosynthesis protein RibF [Clostridium sp. CAG:967]|nr:riboflavin biosynthesis protein RibF [Clostridium sp. CAG:967]
MQIFSELNKNPNLSLALGYFDGVHLGHQAVIKNAVDFAHQNGNKSAVITFSDHPCCYFWGVCPKYILTRKEREEKIAELGVDYLYELDFESISGLTAEDYLKNILVKHFTPSSISTGWNHNFGYKKSGNVKFLAQHAKKFDYKYFELPPQKKDNEIISSTSIRKLLSAGKIEKANSMLGYNFLISGEVITGNRIGRTIGFKTANLLYPPELIDLPFGVYSVDTQFGKGIANFGTRPTVDGKGTLLEVHILDFDKDIYGQNLTVKFNKMIRTEKKFPSLDALKTQIKLDINSI